MAAIIDESHPFIWMDVQYVHHTCRIMHHVLLMVWPVRAPSLSGIATCILLCMHYIVYCKPQFSLCPVLVSNLKGSRQLRYKLLGREITIPGDGDGVATPGTKLADISLQTTPFNFAVFEHNADGAMVHQYIHCSTKHCPSRR